MIYVCVPSHNNSATIGLLLWKIKKVFDEYPREYHLLVADDCSTDTTRETLGPYQRALPMAVLRHQKRKGYAASMEALLREALRRSDRPKRDCAIIIPPDFSVSPEGIPDLLRKIESGADVVVGELDQDATLAARLVRRTAGWLLKPGVNLPGLRDPLSGFCAFRLVTLKQCLRERNNQRLLITDGVAANAELVARAAQRARQIYAVPGKMIRLEGARQIQDLSLASALDLFRAGRKFRVPAPATEVQR